MRHQQRVQQKLAAAREESLQEERRRLSPSPSRERLAKEDRRSADSLATCTDGGGSAVRAQPRRGSTRSSLEAASDATRDASRRAGDRILQQRFKADFEEAAAHFGIA